MMPRLGKTALAEFMAKFFGKPSKTPAKSYSEHRKAAKK